MPDVTSSDLRKLDAERVRVRVKLPADIKSFSDLAGLASALRYLDNLKIESLLTPTEDLRFRKGGRSQLVRFESESPGIFSILTDPAWLTLFVVILAEFDRLEENIPRVLDRVDRILDRVYGLSRQMRHDIEIGVRLLLEQLREQPPEKLRRIKRIAANRRKEILREGQLDELEMEVEDEA